MSASAVLLTIAAAAGAGAGAAMLRFACIPWVAEGYRFLGAGENAVKAAAAVGCRPHFSAVVVGTMLLVWAWYALAGAGMALPPPLLHPVLFVIGAVLILRAMVFPLLRPKFPGNSELFWVVSSGLVGGLGLLFLVGALFVRKNDT